MENLLENTKPLTVFFLKFADLAAGEGNKGAEERCRTSRRRWNQAWSRNPELTLERNQVPNQAQNLELNLEFNHVQNLLQKPETETGGQPCAEPEANSQQHVSVCVVGGCEAESWVHLAVVASSAAASQQVAFKALKRREILLIPD